MISIGSGGVLLDTSRLSAILIGGTRWALACRVACAGKGPRVLFLWACGGCLIFLN